MKWINKNLAVVIILLAVAAARIPTLFEPYWYGDEDLYLAMGQAVRAGEVLYKDILDYPNKPPLIYWLAAAVDGDQFKFRVVAAGWNMATVAAFAILAGKIWPDKRRAVFLSTGIFAALTNLPLLEGNIPNGELFFLLPTVGAAAILTDKRLTAKRLLWGGMVLGAAGLFKIPALAEAGIWPAAWWAMGEKKWIPKSMWLAGGIIITLGISTVVFSGQVGINNFIGAVFGQNLPYLSSWSGAGTSILGLKTRLIAAAIGMALVCGLAKRIGKWGTLAGIWGVITLFAALLSGRPYPHYLLQTTAAMGILAGLLVFGKKGEKAVAISLICLAIAAFNVYGFYTYRTVSYYANFINWAAGAKNTPAYYDWFGGEVNNYYEIARTVKAGSRENDKILVWGNAPAIYTLAHRRPVGPYVTRYLVHEYKAEAEMSNQVKSALPIFIVDMGHEDELPGLADLLEARYMQAKKVGQTTIYRLSGIQKI